MIGSKLAFLSRLWFLVVIILIAGNLILLSLNLSTTAAKSHNRSIDFANVTINANTISASMAAASHKFGQVVDSTGQAIGHAGQTVGQTIHSGATSVVGGLVGGMGFMARTSGHVVGSVSSSTHLSALIKPADKAELPEITPEATLPPAQTASQPAATQPTATQPAPVSQPAPQPKPSPAPQRTPAPQVSSVAQWPIHGAITTMFGASDWPYESVHTGIDISDGKGAGTTPIKPYKPGVVSEIVHSYAGLGNHVTVDHGGGITSVYGHMYSVSVQQGQKVDVNTTLGYEGSTGASTGTHLHFEIRINGQAVNPMSYISGHP